MRINKKQKQALSKVAQKYKLKLIMLFGSFANGTNKQGSDFDVSILGESRDVAQNDINLIHDLTKALERDIDLSIINIADPLLKFQVAKNCILLFGKQRDFINFKVRATLEYMDNKHFFDLEYKYLLKKYDQQATFV